MKKKISVIILLIVTLFSMCSCGKDSAYVAVKEPFAIRNGIRFGMTKDEVINVESQNGYTAVDGDPLLIKDVEILETPCDLNYYFDNGKIREFTYHSWFFTPDTVFAAYTSKYGTPHFTDENRPSISTNVFFQYNDNKILSTHKDYCGWLLKYKDCYVLVEIEHHIRNLMSLGKLNYVSINYYLLSYDEMNAMTQAQQKHTQKMQESISNDI